MLKQKNKSNFSIYYLFILLFLSSAWADDCKIEATKLRKCPSKNTNIAPKNYPAQIYYFPPLETENLHRYLEALENGSVIALDNTNSGNVEIAKNPKYKNKIVLVGNSSEISKKNNSSKILPLIPNPTGYQRDFTIFGFDSKTGSIIQNTSKTDLDSEEYSICGAKVKQVDAGDSMGNNDADLGGNIIGFPGGGCLVGENMTPELALKLCGPGNPLIKLNITGTTVGHIDELINIIPNQNNAPPCDFSITVPSLTDMKSILEQNKKDYFFDPQKNLAPFNSDGSPRLVNQNNEKNVNGNSHESICAKLENLSLLKNIDKHQKAFPKDNPNNESKSVFNKYILNILIENAQAGAGLPVAESEKCNDTPIPLNVFVDASEEVGRKPQTRKEKCLVESTIKDYGFDKIEPTKFKCNQIKNEDILELLNLDPKWVESVINKIPKTINGIAIKKHISLAANLSNLKDINAGNNEIQNSIDENIKTLKNNLPSECMNKNMFTTLPYLFLGGRSLNPNPSNLLVIGKTAIVPMQFNNKTSAFISKKLSAAGLKATEENTFYQHVGGGNVHCLTNEIRGCAQ